MERAIEVFAALNFLVIGLSHVFQHAAWSEFFVLLRSQGRAGAFANGFLSLIMGALIVSFHNVWTGIPAVLTVMGWCLVVKSLVVFLNPEGNLRSMTMVTPEHSRRFIPAGVIFLVVAAMLGYELWRG
jgi:hypothetical protein